jgi:hypothetical protein
MTSLISVGRWHSGQMGRHAPFAGSFCKYSTGRIAAWQNAAAPAPTRSTRRVARNHRRFWYPLFAMDVGRASDATCLGWRIRLCKSALTQASGSITAREWAQKKFVDNLRYGQLAAPNTATTG